MFVLIADSADGLDVMRRDESIAPPFAHDSADAAIEALLPHASSRMLTRLKVSLIPAERWKRADAAAAWACGDDAPPPVAVVPADGLDAEEG